MGNQADRERANVKRIAILFGGLNKERLVSVATAQALNAALPSADLWFWDLGDTVHETTPAALQSHSRPFEEPFTPESRSLGNIETALDKAKADDCLLVLCPLARSCLGENMFFTNATGSFACLS